MRIDAKETIGPFPKLLVRKALRRLRSRLQFGLADLEAAASLEPGDGRVLLGALRSEGLVKEAGRDVWTITQAGQTFSSATAARRVLRVTAEEALQQFLERVQRVNSDTYFLAKVTKVVLFGSMLKPEVKRLSDVDLAVELAPKEVKVDRARSKNYRRVEDLASRGHRFPNFLEREMCWHREVFRFLKGHSRVIALADYNAEKTFVLAVPHRVLLGDAESTLVPSAGTPHRFARKRRPRDCPF